MTEYNGLKGTNLVLWATEEDRRAIRLVSLFLYLAPLVGRSVGASLLQVKVQELHEHFHHFIAELVRSGMMKPNEPLFSYREWCKCPAVQLYMLAYDYPDNRRAWAFDLLGSIEPPTNIKEILCARAELGGISGHVSYENLFNAVKNTLVLMGSIRAVEEV